MGKDYDRLVAKIAKQHAGRGFSQKELVKHGLTGFEKAQKAYARYTHNCKFADYATWWIHAYMLMAINSKKKS